MLKPDAFTLELRGTQRDSVLKPDAFTLELRGTQRDLILCRHASAVLRR
jgi:hypothetical protein